MIAVSCDSSFILVGTMVFLVTNNVLMSYIVPAVALPVSMGVSVKSRAKLRGRFSSTHTSTDPSFSTTTYDSEDNDMVGTAKNR